MYIDKILTNLNKSIKSTKQMVSLHLRSTSEKNKINHKKERRFELYYTYKATDQKTTIGINFILQTKDPNKTKQKKTKNGGKRV